MRRAFTLIELLIVVAIIGILAAIAVPNFLNAQIRAKISRTYSDLRMIETQNTIRQTDIGLWLIDGNDAGPAEKCRFLLHGTSWGKTPETSKRVGIAPNHFNGQIYSELTSPISYMNNIPMDPFIPDVFYGYEDRDCSNHDGSHYLIFAGGPDGDSGDWLTGRAAKPYKSSNGLTSNGDVWLSRELRGHYYIVEMIEYRWD